MAVVLMAIMLLEDQIIWAAHEVGIKYSKTCLKQPLKKKI